MDQAISVLGELNACMLIKFNPIRWENVPMPTGAKFIVTNTLVFA